MGLDISAARPNGELPASAASGAAKERGSLTMPGGKTLLVKRMLAAAASWPISLITRLWHRFASRENPLLDNEVRATPSIPANARPLEDDLPTVSYTSRQATLLAAGPREFLIAEATRYGASYMPVDEGTAVCTKLMGHSLKISVKAGLSVTLPVNCPVGLSRQVAEAIPRLLEQHDNGIYSAEVLVDNRIPYLASARRKPDGGLEITCERAVNEEALRALFAQEEIDTIRSLIERTILQTASPSTPHEGTARLTRLNNTTALVRSKVTNGPDGHLSIKVSCAVAAGSVKGAFDVIRMNTASKTAEVFFKLRLKKENFVEPGSVSEEYTAMRKALAREFLNQGRFASCKYIARVYKKEGSKGDPTGKATSEAELGSYRAVAGVPLDTLTGSPPSTKEDRSLRLSYIKDVAMGVGALHQAKEVHCDIKPSNMIATKVAEDSTATTIGQLTDFGDMTYEGRVATGLTPSYADKEATFELNKEHSLGWRASREADIFALGLSLFELLFGHEANPFRKSSPSWDASYQELVQTIRDDTQKNPTHAAANRLILRMVCDDRKQRIAIGKVIEELSAVLEAETSS